MNQARIVHWILFLEGLASTGLQMVAIRQTTPFVGSSVISTSIIISVFLGALAAGYYFGGKTPASHYQRKLVWNLVFSMVLFGLGLSYVFVSLFFGMLSNVTSNIFILGSPLIHLMAYALLILAPLVFLLGQTVPLLLNTALHTRTSEAAGNYTAISTVGNVIGCLLTPLVLMYFLGVSASIIVNCLLLAFCAIRATWLQPDPSRELGPNPPSIFHVQVGLRRSIPLPRPHLVFQIITPLIVIWMFALSVWINVYSVQQLDADGVYANIRMSKTTSNGEEGTVMFINNSPSSFIGHKTLSGWPYIEFMKSVVFAGDPTGKDVLVLGAGGFSLTAQGTHGANVTYVDIDANVKGLSEARIYGTLIKGTFIAEDARRFLLTSKEQFDFIVLDVYSDRSAIPAHISTAEFFTLVSDHLKEQGRVLLNLVISPTLTDTYSKNMDYTVRRAFPFCVTQLSNYTSGWENVVYLCRKKKSSEDLAGSYFDDMTKVDIDGVIAKGNRIND